MTSGTIPGSQPIYNPTDIKPPEYQSIMTLLKWSGILELIIGILEVIFGLITLVLIIGIVYIILGAVSLFVYTRINNIKKMVDQKQYTQAKTSTLLWGIVALLFSFLITGILMILAYTKFDALITKEQQMAFTQSPPNPPVQ